MDVQNIHSLLSCNYGMDAQSIELNREGGNVSYTVNGGNNKYFLKIIRPPFLETAMQSIDIQMYLLRSRFPVIPIVLTQAGTPCVLAEDQGRECIFVLYDYIDGGEPDPEDTQKAGALIGKLHQVMKGYPGRLPVRDRHFFIDRYIEIMKKLKYPKMESFLAYGNELWEKVKDLSRGYCHCDLYRGNIHKAGGKAMYVVDFDTSCMAFPMYDVVLFCNDTHYFEFQEEGFLRSKARLERFMAGYSRYCSLSKEEISAFYHMIAMYHFQLQATMLELYGYDTGKFEFFDRQYDWLIRWKEQCQKMNSSVLSILRPLSS